MQVHLAYPLTTEQSVFGPQGDGLQGCVGSLQGVSGGLPMYEGKQKHVGRPPITRQSELGPHGFGWHSAPSGTGIK